MSSSSDAHRVRIFVFGSMLRGEPDHGLLVNAESLGDAVTVAAYHLIDLGAYAALIPCGTTSVRGEVYSVDLAARSRIDVARQVPTLFQREPVQLVDIDDADAYVMTVDQVRGRRRIHHGDWRQRFTTRPRGLAPSPWSAWARSRFSKP
jgi:gamma-glutamylcyclotransferase (GGCT)/AIG2-like uncharacterized protein YtfP